MDYCDMAEDGNVRSIFVSDVHLGCKYAQTEAFLQFLHRYDPDYIYLVGDFIDGWRLKRNWHWRPEYNRILHRLVEMAMNGCEIRYTPGNHDSFLRHFLNDFGLVEVADQFVHLGADGRCYLVLHGDQFDHVEGRAQWLSMLGTIGYDGLCWINRKINQLRRWLRLDLCHFSASVKSCVTKAVTFVSRFEQRLTQHARSACCDGIICGHVHTPAISEWDDIRYCNTGDWVENCSALLEYHDGQMEIVRFSAYHERRDRLPARGDERQGTLVLQNASVV